MPITRRRFLAGSLAAGAGLLLPRPLRAAAPAADPNRWALLADTHIWEDREKLHNGVKPADHFVQVTREILALDPRPAGLLIAGDCVFLDGHAADYAVLADVVKPLRAAGIPLHFLLGNHDNRENFWAAFPEEKKGTVPICRNGPEGASHKWGLSPFSPLVPGRQVEIVETPHANWFLLDSLEKTHSTPGLLGKEQLGWLGKTLDARADKPALVVAHHTLDEVGGLKDSPALMKVLLPRKHVKAYIFGHSHIWHVSAKEGLHLVNLPAVAWVFDKSQPLGWVDMQLRAKGAQLVLNTLDKKHPKCGQRVDLKWR
jgi:3',5'-cyclic-AMP phosphodiesterase